MYFISFILNSALAAIVAPADFTLVPGTAQAISWTGIPTNDCTITTYLGKLEFVTAPGTLPGGSALPYTDGTAETITRIRIQGADATEVETFLTNVSYDAKTFTDETGGDLTVNSTDLLEISCTDGSTTETKTTYIGISGAWIPPERLTCSEQGNWNPISGLCECIYPYQGTDCSEIDCGTCLFSGNTCDTSTGICTCTPPYSGDNCEYIACPHATCNGNGNCDRFSGICYCYEGFFGETCDQIKCLNDCNANGICDYSTGECTCYDRFFGTDCAYKKCPRDCGAYGGCNPTTGLCRCSGDYSESDCMFSACPVNGSNTCSNNGLCDHYTGTCICNDGFVGVDCSLTV